MAALELYGKCKELGHCDCGGFSVARHLGRWSIAKSATAATLPVIPTSPTSRATTR